MSRSAHAVGITLLDRATNTTDRVEADVVAVADGACSAIRRALHPKWPMLHWPGVQMWRGITDRDSFGDGETMYIAP